MKGFKVKQKIVDQCNEPDTKNRIFQIAAHLFAQKGFSGVSMREISELSGVTKPTIYYHFGSKEQIYKELIDAGLEHNEADMDRIRTMKLSLKDALIELIKEKFRDCEQYPDFFRIFLDLYLSIEKLDYIEEFKIKAQQPLRQMAKMLKDGIASGEINRQINPLLAGEMIAGVVMYYIGRQIERGGKIQEGLAEEIIEHLFNGLHP